MLPEVSALTGVSFALRRTPGAGTGMSLLTVVEEPAGRVGSAAEEERAKAREDGGDDDDWEDCADDEEDDEDEEGGEVAGEAGGVGARSVSRALRARLLTVCSSVAYLCGDAVGAVRCLRASVGEDRLGDGTLLDAVVKLGSLLIDMDELDEAASVLVDASRRCGSHGDAAAVVLLHRAELLVNKSEFHGAVALLRQAQKIVQGPETEWVSAETAPALVCPRNQPQAVQEAFECEQRRRTRLSLAARRALRANVYALLGVAQFRCSPSSPELSLRTLQDGMVLHPESMYLLLCTGEVVGQTGDAVKALRCFARAARLDPGHPLPLVNAARTYTQLSQPVQAAAHLACAIRLDPALATIRVDAAQSALLAGRTAEALEGLEGALGLARHVSEIRDVLTALTVARMQLQLQQEGLYAPPVSLQHACTPAQ
jgi:tetratricopeptide (TPR) repeat protein